MRQNTHTRQTNPPCRSRLRPSGVGWRRRGCPQAPQGLGSQASWELSPRFQSDFLPTLVPCLLSQPAGSWLRPRSWPAFAPVSGLLRCLCFRAGRCLFHPLHLHCVSRRCVCTCVERSRWGTQLGHLDHKPQAGTFTVGVPELREPWISGGP